MNLSNKLNSILKELDYDIVNYDAGDIRNKTVIETISKNNMTDKSVISMFNNNPKKIAIIMDEIDGMNNFLSTYERFIAGNINPNEGIIVKILKFIGD